MTCTETITAALEATQEIRRCWQDGIASGPGRLGDIDALKREARRRLADGQGVDPGRCGRIRNDAV